MSDAPIEAEEPKSKILMMTIVAILVIIIAIAVVRVLVPKTVIKAETVEYNGFIFTKDFAGWTTNWQRDNQLYEITLRYNPYEVENISIRGKLNSTFDNEPIYVTFDPNEADLKYTGLATSELSLNIVIGLDKKIEPSCTSNDGEGCKMRPIVSCADTDKAVISIEVKNETGIVLDGNCVRVQGKNFELTRAVDRIIYQWFRIMQ